MEQVTDMTTLQHTVPYFHFQWNSHVYLLVFGFAPSKWNKKVNRAGAPEGADEKTVVTIQPSYNSMTWPEKSIGICCEKPPQSFTKRTKEQQCCRAETVMAQWSHSPGGSKPCVLKRGIIHPVFILDQQNPLITSRQDLSAAVFRYTIYNEGIWKQAGETRNQNLCYSF